jgi:hypothetical protein
MSAQGKDVSAFQTPLNLGDLNGLDFAFTKATNGLGLVDPDLSHNWAVLAEWGKPRGAYHELTATSSASAQAAFFVATVRACGLKALDMLAVVASDYPGVTGADVKTFCDTVARLAGPHCPVLVYTDPAVAPRLGSCTGYPLWVAAYQSAAPDVAPWRTWRFWQWGDTPVDHDAYNGTAADLHAWLQTYAATPKPPVPPTPEEAQSMNLNVGKNATTDIAVWPGGHVVFFTGGTARVNVDMRDGKADEELDLSYASAHTIAIPKGCHGIVAHRMDDGTRDVNVLVTTT